MNNTFAKAYTEVYEIISHFSNDELSKLPIEKIEFYKNNMDKNYSFKINPKIDLDRQNISIEAKAIIITLFRDYFATEEQKVKIKEILDMNQKNGEQEKREKYNPNDIFKKQNKEKNINIETTKNENTTALVEYKQSFFVKLKYSILRIFHINNK